MENLKKILPSLIFNIAETAIIVLMGTYLVTMPNHITTVIDGVVYDTFDCRDRILWDVWKVE